MARKGVVDNHLYELMFQYGRYLLISSSRPGTMPANLQGIWANKIQTPWNGDYHTDVNVEMNYWPSEVTNLSEMHLPLFDLIESLVKPGSRKQRYSITRKVGLYTRLPMFGDIHRLAKAHHGVCTLVLRHGFANISVNTIGLQAIKTFYAKHILY